MADSPLALAQNRILQFICAKGITSKEEILRYNYKQITVQDLDNILLVLTRGGLVREFLLDGKIKYESLL